MDAHPCDRVIAAVKYALEGVISNADGRPDIADQVDVLAQLDGLVCEVGSTVHQLCQSEQLGGIGQGKFIIGVFIPAYICIDLFPDGVVICIYCAIVFWVRVAPPSSRKIPCPQSLDTPTIQALPPQAEMVKKNA